MNGYLIFFIIACITVLSPGPGVVLTITNAARFGVLGAIPGILGIALATFFVAGIAATGLAVVLSTSSSAFTILKYIGAVYLIFLGIKLWKSPGVDIQAGLVPEKSLLIGFIEGFTLQLTNPKAVFFFISIFPQFVKQEEGFLTQFLPLVSTYSGLVVTIHLMYARLASTARGWLSTASNGRLINKVGGSVFAAFGVGLVTASK